MSFKKLSKKNKKYLSYNNIKHKFNAKYNKVFKHTVSNILKDSRYEIDTFTQLSVIKN